MVRKLLVLFVLSVASPEAWSQTKTTGAVPATPSAAQLAWHETNFYLFFHFGPNTFTNLEWGQGTEIQDLFNPGALDCDQWCRVAKQAGAKGVVITAKHHDGFCLWPSKYSTHTVRESKWKNGRGDVLRELSDACRRHGLRFGVYLSPWDRNHPQYGTPAYNDVYANTLTELLTGYGALFEIWWDGANGEGPNGKKQEYDFHRFEKLAAQYQPGAVIFSDIGPGCRWAGNEQGTVGETNWCMLDTAGFGRGSTGPPSGILQQGVENGALWIPAECDVSIRPGWFYHAEEDKKVKTPEQLFDIYLHSAGYGANLILNVPPDRSGRIHPQDSAVLAGLGDLLRERFARNLALHKRCRIPGRADAVRFLTDGHPVLPTNDPGMDLSAVELDLGSAETFSMLVLQEHLPSGQRIKSFKVEAWDKKAWREIARSTTVGPKKILRFPALKARKLKISVIAANGAPLLSEISIYP